MMYFIKFHIAGWIKSHLRLPNLIYIALFEISFVPPHLASTFTCCCVETGNRGLSYTRCVPIEIKGCRVCP